jgi:hypothetical protein
VSSTAITLCVASQECLLLLLLLISLSIQSGNFWIRPRTYLARSPSNNQAKKAEGKGEKSFILQLSLLLGLFNSDHLEYHLLANATKQPTLEEMTRVAIKVLRKNDKGFFLFVEGK